MHYSVRMTKPSIGIGVLSWRAHKTLIQSLDSYRDNGFLDLFDQRIIYFSDITDADREIAKQYGWECAGGPNEGIAGGMKRLAENMTTDYILLLQNDNIIIEDAGFARQHISSAVELMQAGRCDLARMRHRWIMGEPSADVNKYLNYYPAQNVSQDFRPEEHNEKKSNYRDNLAKMIKRALRPIKAWRLRGRCIYIESEPEKIYPKQIKRQGDFLIIDSSILHFTDQCLLISRSLWLDVLVPYVDANPSKTRRPNGFQAPEICINGAWWRNKHYKIAQGLGVFGNARIDGSYRPDHIGYEAIEK